MPFRDRAVDRAAVGLVRPAWAITAGFGAFRSLRAVLTLVAVYVLAGAVFEAAHLSVGRLAGAVAADAPWRLPVGGIVWAVGSAVA